MKKKNLVLGGIAAGVLAGVATALFIKQKKTIPKGATPVSPFMPKKYTGKWYEIARMDARATKNLDNVTSEYTLYKDGTMRVVNSGYDYVKSRQVQSEGVMSFVHSPKIGMLTVAYGRSLKSGYNVLAVDDNYKYALVAGSDLHSLWILSREPSIPSEVKRDYLQKARLLGYKTDQLVWSEHS